MKTVIIGIILTVFSFVCYFAYGATNGTVTKVLQEGDCRVYKYVVGDDMTDSETFTFGFTGNVIRIVIDGTATDADGDFSIKDISDANYVKWDNVLASKADIDYVVTSQDNSSNTYGGAFVAGQSTGTLTNMADAKPVTIWIYCTEKK